MQIAEAHPPDPATTERKILVAVNENGIRMGEGHSNAIFTDHEVELVRQLHEEGMTYEVLAEKFECSKSTISKICQFKRRAATVARWKILLIEVPISLSEK